MKKRIVVVCLLLLVLFAATALASTPTHGRTRIYGYKDEIKRPRNMFAPYAVYPYLPHVEDQYLEFYYNKHDSHERTWNLCIVDEDGDVENMKDDTLNVYLPYPSIWSAKNQEYWKWTKNYATKHYDWEWARGYYTGSLSVIDKNVGTIFRVLTYKREKYRPVRNLELFGPCITLDRSKFFNGVTLFVSIGSDKKSSTKNSLRLDGGVSENGQLYCNADEIEELVLPEGVVAYRNEKLPFGMGNEKMNNLKRIVWPESMIDGSCLAELAPNLKEIWYAGSEEEWKNTTGWTLFKNVKVTYEYKD